MAKLTKKEITQHNKVKDLINSDKVLSFDEKVLLLENYHEGSASINSEAGAFFTPNQFAIDFSLDIGDGNLLDLCAGIGALSFWKFQRDSKSTKNIVCVELNPIYVELGKRILPEADWVLGDTLNFYSDIKFDHCYSNPPFGNIKTSNTVNKNNIERFEYRVIEKASSLAKNGSFIIPSSSANFSYSGQPFFRWIFNPRFEKFSSETGIDFVPGVGIDTSLHKDSWKGVSVNCEVVRCYFQNR